MIQGQAALSFQAATALVLALSFVLVRTRQTRGMRQLSGVQTGLVAIGAMAQGHPWVAAVEVVEAGVLLSPLPVWAWGDSPTNGRPPQAKAVAGQMTLGVVLAILATTVGSVGLAAATILLGLLVLAMRRSPQPQALAAVTAQNGLVLAALTDGLTQASLAAVVVPVLPVLLVVGLWLNKQRRAVAAYLAAARGRWLDVTLCCAALLLACLLPWQIGNHGSIWTLDARAAHMLLLLAALAAAASWAPRPECAWGSRTAILAGTALSVLLSEPFLSWLGAALATAGSAANALPHRAEAWRRLRLGCIALGLALLGTIGAAASSSLPAAGLIILGYGALAVLAPELTIAAAAVILRLRGVAPDGLLLAAGLAGVLLAATGMNAWPRRQRGILPLAGLAQGGVAVFAFGLGGSGDLAGLLQLTLLALTQCALLLASSDGLDRLAGLAGLAAIPPFGVFPGLALIVAATASRQPWLLLPLGVGLAGVVWPVLQHLPADRQLRASPAWLPLVLALVLGFAMPDPLLAWFRLAAR